MNTRSPMHTAELSQPTTGWRQRRLAAALALACLGSLTGCGAPLLMGGLAMGGVMVQTDRRTSGAQVEDQSIELRGGSRVSKALAGRGHVSVTSYNRIALISGEVPTEADRAAAEKAVAGVENLRSVVNELAVQTAASLSERSSDVLLLTKVKATLVDAGDLESNAFKVVIERGIVYLMGRVTEAEASRAVSLIRTIDKVQKVVRVLEIITDEELADIRAARAQPVKPGTAKPGRGN